MEEVACLTMEDIEKTPDFGTSLDTIYILGMAKIRGSVKSILDIDKVVSSESPCPNSEELTQSKDPCDPFIVKLQQST